MTPARPRPIPTYSTLPYSDFLTNASTHNTPFLLTGATSSWPASKWDLSSLRAFAHHNVQVADTLKREFNEFERTEMELGEVLDLWERGEGEGLYVKDWHQVLEVEKEGGSQAEVYETPDVFKDDWLTHYYLSLPSPSRSDYRFTYLGPAGTYTPLHIDVHTSYSWSANVVGMKRWWLVPPEHVDWFREKDGLVFDVREREGWEERVVVVDQEPGEIIFVPSGWAHNVSNLTFCISINQNFLNSATLPRIYTALLASLTRVELSILDVKDMLQQRLGEEASEDNPELKQREVEWVEQVQSLLEMDAGWGLRVFWEMVAYNLKNPPAPPHLRPEDGYVFEQVRPIVRDFRQRREWVVMSGVREIVEEVSRIVGA